MKATKIDWCDCTANCVVGCPRGCEYCYARKLNNRFGFVKDWNKPQFFPERLKQFESKTPKSVFINSMSDIAYWREEWVAEVLRAILRNPQHRYIALTKDYDEWRDICYNIAQSYDIEFNRLEGLLFVGRTVTRNESQLCCGARADFVNIEPILEAIDTDNLMAMGYYDGGMPIGNAIIVGAETGNRRGKVVPPTEWIERLVRFADEVEIPIFMKESLRIIMGNDFRQDKLPWSMDK